MADLRALFKRDCKPLEIGIENSTAGRALRLEIIRPARLCLHVLAKVT